MKFSLVHIKRLISHSLSINEIRPRNVRIKTKNHALDPKKDFLTKSISEPYDSVGVN